MPDPAPETQPAAHERRLPSPAPFFDRRTLRAMRLAPPRRGLLAGLRIRKKLALVHTVFSLLLAVFLLLLLRPAVNEIVRRAELTVARAVAGMTAPAVPDPQGPWTLHRGDADALGLPRTLAAAAAEHPGTPVDAHSQTLGACVVVAASPDESSLVAVVATLPQARAAVTRLYLFFGAGLLAAYAMVILALEVFVLPQNVYEPIRQMFAADLAVADGRQRDEIIPESAIPSDELGDIMRSRNQTVLRLRQQEAALADALQRLEAVATDLKRKNHLLEAARRNLADADRLASLGMMSAGIAHELNTPLAVLKGLVEGLHADPRAGIDPARAGLMLRVVGRLERLSEGLLDFARVRPPQSRPADLHAVVQEALTLVTLDRETAQVEWVNAVPPATVAECDPDRLVQVFVNLLRNAADAIATSHAPGRVVVRASHTDRDGQGWLSITVEDNGPGIDAAVLPSLFEPFTSSRLDSRGTGLGLAVSGGIVSEHGGVLLARNRTDSHGAVFEVVLPVRAQAPHALAESPTA